jgi:hypothetical protein
MSTLVLQKPHLIERLEQIAVKRKTTPETLLDMAVEEFLDKAEFPATLPQRTQLSAPPEFLQEIAAFEKLKPELLKQYKGRAVGIYQGEVVAVGDDILSVHDTVINKFGQVPCYVEWVEEQTPRIARITSVWRKR